MNDWREWDGIYRDGCYRSILVVGPQRAGTRLTGRIAASEVGLRFCEHTRFKSTGYGLRRLLTCAPAVIHNPSLTALTPFLDGAGVLVLMVFRNAADIHASEDRIGWTEHDRERILMGAGVSVSPAEEKMRRMEEWACLPWTVTVRYDALQSHPLWVPKADRMNWDAHAWRMDHAG